MSLTGQAASEAVSSAYFHIEMEPHGFPPLSSAEGSTGLAGRRACLWGGGTRRACSRYLLLYLFPAAMRTAYCFLAMNRGGEQFKAFAAGAALVFVERHFSYR